MCSSVNNLNRLDSSLRKGVVFRVQLHILPLKGGKTGRYGVPNLFGV